MTAAAESLQSNVELVLGAGGGMLTDDQRRLLETGWRNGRRLLSQIGDLHTVALVEAGLYEVQWAPADLRELATRAAEVVWPVAYAMRKPLRVETSGPTHVVGAGAVLARAVDALLEYVVEHSWRDTEIVVTVGEGSASATYRAGEPPSSDDLRIALVDAVARLHGGELVTSHDDGAATLTLTVDRAEDAADAA